MSLTPEQIEKRRAMKEERRAHNDKWLNDPEYRHKWEMECHDRTILALRSYLVDKKRTQWFPLRRGVTREAVELRLGDEIAYRKRTIEKYERSRFAAPPSRVASKGVVIPGPASWFGHAAGQT